MKRSSIIFLLVILLFMTKQVQGAYQPQFSTAGFYELPHSGRTVYSLNPAWRFYKGKVSGAEVPTFEDSLWNVVSLPHSLEYLPVEASGCVNYQGEAWYRKHFTPSPELKGQKLFLHFEAIMGKSKVFVNGRLLAEHYGGYLPVVVDVTDALQWDRDHRMDRQQQRSQLPSRQSPGSSRLQLLRRYLPRLLAHCPSYCLHHRPQPSAGNSRRRIVRSLRSGI